MTLDELLACHLVRGQGSVFLVLELFEGHLRDEGDSGVRATVRADCVLLVQQRGFLSITKGLVAVRLGLSSGILAAIEIRGSAFDDLLLLGKWPGTQLCIRGVAEWCRTMRRGIRLLLARGHLLVH